MRRPLHLSLSFLAVTLFSVTSSACSPSKLEGIHAPILGTSELTPTKKETIWSRLTFGHYPNREIVDGSFDSVADYAYEESDILSDPDLYRELTLTDWSKGEATLHGRRFERLLEPETPSTAQHYAYKDPGRKYHYFECEPLTWRVLSLEGSKATLMADKALDCLTYNEDESGSPWKDCSVHGFLNSKERDGFLGKAFDEKERKALLIHKSKESVNGDYNVSSGEESEDYVYLLDHDEMFSSDTAASYGFYAGRGYDDPAKRFKSTMYAKFRGTWYSPVKGYRGNCFYFMRTVGYRKSYVSYICDFGYIYSRGTSADCFDAGIVPVIDVDLSKADFEKKEERSSTMMMQSGDGESLSEKVGANAWESIEYGEYPQDEVRKDDPRYDVLSDRIWLNDETELDGVRYRKIDDRYFEYQPISWRILEKEGGFALLFASSGLDCHPFHDSLANTDWSKCELRRYLNADFLDLAFPYEDEAILEKVIANKPNHYFGTDCGIDTKDRVFLLSEEDVFGGGKSDTHGFAPSDATQDEGRRIVPTDYAKAKGAWVSKDGNGFYSLRSVGYSNANAVYIGELGDIYNRGIPVTCNDMTLVPAMWVDLSLIK